MACAVEPTTAMQQSASQLLQRYVAYRHRTDKTEEKPGKGKRDDDKKLIEIQKKLTEATSGMSTTTAKLDELFVVPKAYFNERLSEIRELEERMTSLRHESEYALEQKEQENRDKLATTEFERKREKGDNETKYDTLFSQLKKANERHQHTMNASNVQFDRRTKELQDEFENGISKEYDKQSRLLNELQNLRDSHDTDMRVCEDKNNQQLNELRNMQEKASREWRSEYDKVCNLLKSDGLKFEEALRQQEGEYESQISEILEHKRVALQVESEKSTTALKDGVSMRQTISMLHRQLKSKDDELIKARDHSEDLQKKLDASREMFQKVEINLKERERGLKVKDESLAKLREQMKHLESFRFVLFHKVRALEEERDPLEEQVNSLKTSVREMYGEFVREFRQKQKLDQQLTEKTALASSNLAENVGMRNQMIQLKKDARQMIQEVETILHAETQADFELMPKRLREVLEKHKKLNHWAPRGEDEGADKTEQEQAQDSMLIQEMMVQRDLLFRKNQIAVSQASQNKRDCTQDFRRLTSENAQLIAEMNTLRNENKSWQRSYKDLEASLLALKSKIPGGAAALAAGAVAGMGGRNASAPQLGSGPGGSGPPAAMGPGGKRSGKAGSSTANTPFMQRKVVDKEEVYRRQKQKESNMLPPVGGKQAAAAGSSAGMVTMTAKKAPATNEEKMYQQAMEKQQQRQRKMEDQGFEVGRLGSVAQQMSGFYDGAELTGEESPMRSPAAIVGGATSSGAAAPTGGSPSAAPEPIQEE